MIYLKVRGGLCNRIRAIDSVFSLCKKNKKKLIVLWPKDIALNADFDELFDKPQFNEFQFDILNCPSGYPETYLPNLENRIKNLLKNRKLDKRLATIAKEIYNLPKNRVMSESFLDAHYNTIIYETQGNVEEMDDLFCKTLRDTTNELMKNDSSVYINSCYRLHEVEDNYSNFIPKKDIVEKITQTTTKFDNTYGLHIRRSDHEASKKYSTLDKFIEVIEREISDCKKATFFLSTDDESTKENLIAKYGKIIIYNEIASFDRNSPEAVKEAVLDLYCLSNTKKLYGSHHSSFSQVAAKMGNVSEVTVK